MNMTAFDRKLKIWVIAPLPLECLINEQSKPRQFHLLPSFPLILFLGTVNRSSFTNFISLPSLHFLYIYRKTTRHGKGKQIINKKRRLTAMAPTPSLLTTAALCSLAALSGLSQARPFAESQSQSLKHTRAPAAADDCTCYKASSDTHQLYGNRKFFDFRTISNPSKPAPISSGRSADQNAGATHPYFSTADWADFFHIQNWSQDKGAPGSDSTVDRVNSANNFYIGSDSGTSHLALRSVRQADYQSTAEAESAIQDFEYLTLRFYARTVGDGGAVTSIFTFASNTQEADEEIRTFTDPHVIQYTNQPGNVDGEEQPEATRLVNLQKPWTDWLEYRYDWTPGSSDWYIDGEKVASIQFQTPTDPLLVIMNVWGDGGSWSDVMKVGGSAEMQIRWLDVTYNRAGSQPKQGDCGNVCVVDDLIR
ncbi:concanavalin A-like lectin/glucanase domain-containing protein [Xylariaceae sp. FL0594]|nr:concanavalin A-like lectin/glucanase domain-containing protein [Xylariaceae sp. FL0594]